MKRPSDGNPLEHLRKEAARSGGRKSRGKGKRGERKLANELRAAFPELAKDIRRGWQTRRGDDDPDIVGIPGFWFEHKSGAQPNVRAALAQAVAESKGRGIPVAVIRDDRCEPFAAVRLIDLFDLMSHRLRSS